MDPVKLFEAATQRAVELTSAVRTEQLSAATPCRDWDVRALLHHLRGGPANVLAGATGSSPRDLPDLLDVDDVSAFTESYRDVLAECLAALRQPGALERRFLSPLGFEWSVAEATAGTFMDQLIHGWDLAVATGQDRTLDPQQVEVCVAMFLPEMPEHGRAAGIVGPAIAVPDDAPAQQRLLAAMGRQA